MERLVNGGFDTCDLTGWAVEPAALARDVLWSTLGPIIDGDRCYAGVYQSYDPWQGDTIRLAQTANTFVGLTHRLSFRLSDTGMTSFTVQLQPPPTQPAVVLTPAGSGPPLQLGSTTGNFSFSNAGSFTETQYQIEFLPAAPQTTIRFSLQSARDARLDDVSLTSGEHGDGLEAGCIRVAVLPCIVKLDCA